MTPDQQTNDFRFILLDKEVEYFNAVSEQMTDMIIFKQKNLKEFAMYKSYKAPRTLANFDRILWTEPLPRFFNKFNTNSKEFAIEEEYLNMISYDVVDNIEVQHEPKTETFSILFKHGNKTIDTVEITDKQNLKKALNKTLIRTLSDTYNKLKKSKQPNFWFDWRTEQSELQQLEHDFPEIKGTFN